MPTPVICMLFDNLPNTLTYLLIVAVLSTPVSDIILVFWQQ